MKDGQHLLSQTFTGVHSEMPMKRKISMCTLHYDEVGVTMKEESFSLFHHMWFLRHWRKISAINKLFPYCLTGDKYKHKEHHETDSFSYKLLKEAESAWWSESCLPPLLLMFYQGWVSVDLNLTSRVSSRHSGFLPHPTTYVVLASW